MNDWELRFASTLIETGRLRPEQLQGCLEKRKEGEGLVDTILRQGALDTREVEAALAALPEVRVPEADVTDAAVRRLERYTILKELGRGGMGRVYLAYDTHLKRTVALKVLRVAGAEEAARVRREVEIAAGLHHAHIAAVYEAHWTEDMLVLAMQYIDGRTLGEARLETREALEAIRQAAVAVHYAHGKGIIHRDLKPDNLMRTQDGQVYVLDFGMARSVREDVGLTQSGTIVGTPLFMSPEQAMGRPLDARTDVYSLGATLYALLAGRAPFDGTSVLEVIRQVVDREPLPLSRVHRDIEVILDKAMRKEASQRYPDAAELALDLERFLKGEPIEARPVSRFSKGLRYLLARPWAIATLVVIFLGLAVGIGLLWRDRLAHERLAHDNALLDEADAKIEEWDRLIYMPPEDMTPYQSLLRDAVDLSERAMPLPRAYYQKARALIRLGQDDASEQAINEALRRQADGRFHVERLRIRLHRMTRTMIDPSQLYFAELAVDLGAGVKNVFRQAILEDLEHARRLGTAREFEAAYLNAVEMALGGEYEHCEQVCRDCLKSCARVRQADLFTLLAWNAYLRHLETIPKADLEKVDLADAPHLREARDYLTSAIDLRRSDVELYLFRAHIHLWIANQALGYLASEQDEKPLVARVRKERERIEKVQREACAAARADLEVAAKIRPGGAETRLLVSDLYFGSFPIGSFFDLFLAGEPNRELGRKMAREALEPARDICKEILGKDARNLRAWVQLSIVEYTGTVIGLVTSEPYPWSDFLEATARALALHPEPHVEAHLRFQTALAHGLRYTLGGKKPEERKAALEEIERVAAIRPSLRKQFAQWFPDLK